jgi:N-acetyl-gamma-glutamyl-phosphate reductase
MHGSNAAAVTTDPGSLGRYRDALFHGIAESQITLPLLPQVASELLSILHDPNVDMEHLSELIHRDQALAGHVLRISNSAAYGTGESIVALRDALGADVERVCVVDLAADFRLRDPQRYRAAYGAPHAAPHELAGFVYGLVEHRREEIVGARRVAAPGCFATAMQLAVLPAARAGLLDAQRAWVLDGVTGSSGSGRDPKPATHHPHRHGNLWAYALDGHRHEAELAQALDGLGIAAPLHFVPHSGPFARGIHLTAHLPLARATDVDAVRAVYADAYADQPFVEVLREGVPDLRRVVGSNRASLAVHVRGELLTVLLTLDNMIKGGAGQGLQCLNLMLDMPETWGLARSGLGVA